MILIRANTKKGYEEAEVGDSINVEYPNSLTRRGRVGKQVSQTITTSPQIDVVMGGGTMKENEDYIRKLTPKECFRLMGFDDADFELLEQAGFSNRQLYKMAGNSIVVNVLEFLFCELFDSDNEIWV